VAVAQAVLSNGLVGGISAKIPSLDPSGIISAGATGIRNIVPPDLLPLILTIYDDTMKHVFTIAAVLGGCSFITSLFFEWKSMKGNTAVMV
jgi:hypothetical protein